MLIPEFKKLVDSGKRPWEALDTLQAEDASAMLFWVTALQYEFKEAMLLPSKIINLKWMQYALKFLDRIKEVAPNFGNGAVELAYSVCYCVLPELYEGDNKKCHIYMNETIKKSSGYLLARWGWGKYFHQVTGDIESSRKDLEWVADQDLGKFNDSYPWRVHFKDDAINQISK